MKKLILFSVAIFNLFAMSFFFFISVDIIDGRDNKMLVSPVFHANTNNSALTVIIFLFLMSIISFIITSVNISEHLKEK